MITLVPQSPRAPASHVIEAFAEGLKQHGVKHKFAKAMPGDPFVVCWAWRNGRKYFANGSQTLILERGYIGDRNKWFSAGWNGLNGRADFYNHDVTASRWEKLFASMVRPWKPGGEHILLCGQVPGDMSLQGKDINAMYPKIAQALERYYKIPVVFRPHPLAKGGYQSLDGHQTSTGPMQEALDGAALVWAYNSNSGVDAVMGGTPTAALDKGSMVWEICTHGLGDFRRPDRSEWGRKIAYCQWTVEEMASGECWSHIGKHYDNIQRLAK